MGSLALGTKAQSSDLLFLFYLDLIIFPSPSCIYPFLYGIWMASDFVWGFNLSWSLISAVIKMLPNICQLYQISNLYSLVAYCKTWLDCFPSLSQQNFKVNLKFYNLFIFCKQKQSKQTKPTQFLLMRIYHNWDFMDFAKLGIAHKFHGGDTTYWKKNTGSSGGFSSPWGAAAGHWGRGLPLQKAVGKMAAAPHHWPGVLPVMWPLPSLPIGSKGQSCMTDSPRS